jgi:hypothetical protein
MTLPIPGAYTFKNWSLTLDGTDVSSQIMKAVLKPTQGVQTLKAAVPGAVVQDVADPTWVLELTGVQNNTASTGLAAILRAASGTSVSCVFVPNKVNGEVQATFEAIAVQMELGGETDAFNKSDLSLPVVGDVTWGTYSA